jgi:hypothetical protein
MNTAEMSRSIANEIDTFTQHLDGLHQTLPLTNLMVAAVQYAAQEEHSKFVEHYCETFEENGRLFARVKDMEHYHRWQTLNAQFIRTQTAQELIPRSLLVTLVSQYDAFLGGLLKLLFSYKPEILNTSDRALKFSQLVLNQFSFYNTA